MNLPTASSLVPSRVAVLLLVAGLTGCGGGADKPTQTAARVNKEDITVHQINQVLARQPGLKPEQAQAAAAQVLEQLIDQELAVQKAQDFKLDRNPQVQMQIEAAKREILARAYAEKVGESVAKPSADEVRKYFDANPALFSERRIYNLQELAIEAKPEQFEGLKEKLAAAKTLTDFVEYLKGAGIAFTGNQAVRAAEQLPLDRLDGLAKLKDGQTVLTQTPQGLQVLMLAGSRSQPVDLDRARPAIEAFLSNQRKTELLKQDMKALRAASKIEYKGKFSAPTAAAISASAPASAASGLDDAAIRKGLGIK
ncbi:EpsD family peptidyl-prolyl cis-trans isomerase [Inhella inkyongensis]|uniref:peptidylprolyl isomerase n=1 Tax=Inhella inkyongensis TaxID=392593 RepID=A0A840S479_9BURK|nr:EpsD family peptidyl-prolyl cis-trans isomerase [Inhella inkyongensis]MBB5204362.1 EpsD family peptidyl-prolyl cis-trans isomerase [Inhella inkyongensis]